jgi:hypothetical protein
VHPFTDLKNRISAACGLCVSRFLVVQHSLPYSSAGTAISWQNFISLSFRDWKTRSNPGVWLKETAALNTLLFADDQIIIQESGDELQRSIFYLNNICKSHNLKISINKTKTYAKCWCENLKAVECLGDIGVDGSILLKVILLHMVDGFEWFRTR